jgi:hypothetical protein
MHELEFAEGFAYNYSLLASFEPWKILWPLGSFLWFHHEVNEFLSCLIIMNSNNNNNDKIKEDDVSVCMECVCVRMRV